jgi:hypothetical protein
MVQSRKVGNSNFFMFGSLPPTIVVLIYAATVDPTRTRSNDS